jgi:hypothetical protein
MVWLPWLPNVTPDSPRLTDAGFLPPQKFELPQFKMVEAMGLIIMALRSSSIARPPC